MFQKMDKLFLFPVIFGCVIFFLAEVIPAGAQFKRELIEKVSVSPTKLTTTTPRNNKKRTKVLSNVQKRDLSYKIPVKDRIIKIKTSNLTVTTQGNAEVTLGRLGSNGEVVQTLTDVVKVTKTGDGDTPENGTVEFENLTPGNYKVTSSLEGFEGQETVIEIEPQKTVGISLDLEPIKFQVIIETNIAEGEVRYAPAEVVGRDASGSIITKEKGGYCIAPIKNNKAIVKELQKGFYNIDIRPSPKAIEYEPVLTAINVNPQAFEYDGEDLPKPKNYKINLDTKISKGEFASAWTLEDWFLPAGWKLENGMKISNSSGVALPRNEQYRYYTDFEMVSDVKSNDGGTVGFAVHAVNDQNYYLIQISGARAAEPLVIKGFIIKDGKAEQLISNPIENVAKAIKAGKSFRVRIRGVGNVFEVFIEDSETGESLPLGKISDQYKTFQKGAIGIASRGNSNFEVGFFMVALPSR